MPVGWGVIKNFLPLSEEKCFWVCDGRNTTSAPLPLVCDLRRKKLIHRSLHSSKSSQRTVLRAHCRRVTQRNSATRQRFVDPCAVAALAFVDPPTLTTTTNVSTCWSVRPLGQVPQGQSQYAVAYNSCVAWSATIMPHPTTAVLLPTLGLPRSSWVPPRPYSLTKVRWKHLWDSCFLTGRHTRPPPVPGFQW